MQAIRRHKNSLALYIEQLTREGVVPKDQVSAVLPAVLCCAVLPAVLCYAVLPAAPAVLCSWVLWWCPRSRRALSCLRRPAVL